MMKRTFAILFALTVLLSMTATVFADQPEWTAAYRSVLDAALQKREEEHPDDFLAECSYCLYDIDKDGTPELLLKTGTCEADYTGRIYFFRDGRVSQLGEDIGLSHSGFYAYPDGNGVIVFGGHMGYARAELVTFTDGFGSEFLYEDDLNSRLAVDPTAEYIYPYDVVPGAAPLTLVRAELSLPLSRYEQVKELLDGTFPATSEVCYPHDDPGVYSWIISQNAGVYAVAADAYSRSPGWIRFQELLKKDTAADWMSDDLAIASQQAADLNGDGKMEYILDVKNEGYDHMRIFLSEQDGVFYAYLNNYANDMTVDRNGNILETYYEYSTLDRLIFDGGEAFFLSLPLSYYSG